MRSYRYVFLFELLFNNSYFNYILKHLVSTIFLNLFMGVIKLRSQMMCKIINTYY